MEGIQEKENMEHIKPEKKIKFTITVSNSGTASARNLTIKEEPYKELKKLCTNERVCS